jgi:plastin-1
LAASTNTLSAGGNSGAKITRISGATASTSHSIDEDEKKEFTVHINSVLAGESSLKDRLPFSLDDDSLFEGCKDGLVLR